MQKDNQPLQGRANAYRAKMFRAINGRKYHVKLVRTFLKEKPPNMEKYNIHVEMVLYFHRLANYNREKSIELGNKVKENMIKKNTPELCVSD